MNKRTFWQKKIPDSRGNSCIIIPLFFKNVTAISGGLGGGMEDKECKLCG